MPDQWVDWGDHTVQVDPIRNQAWIYDDSERHVMSANRGRRYDAADVAKLLGWEKSQSQVQLEPREATVTEINRCDLYPAPCNCGVYARFKDADGELPTITALLYENRLSEKTYGDIEAEMREHERRRGARLFSKSNW